MITSKYHKWRPNNYLIGSVIIILFACDQRFANTPVYEVGSGIKQFDHVLLSETLSTEEFDQDDAIQYLTYHENQGWEIITRQEIEHWSEQYKHSAEVLELVSDYYRANDDLENALHFNDLAEKNGASSIGFYKKRANIYAALGEHGLAIDYINKAVAINGSDPDTYLTKGKVYLKLGDSLSALSNMQRAFTNDSSRLDIGVDLAHLYVSAGADETAQEMINYLIERDHMSNELSYLLVRLYRRRGEDERANSLLAGLLEHGKADAGITLVDHFRSQNSLDSIIHYATKVLEIDTLNLAAMEAKAFSFDRKGYFTSALIYYNQMLEIDSLNEEALEGIRKVNGKIAYLRKLREQREAIPTFDFAAPIKRNNLIDE